MTEGVERRRAYEAAVRALAHGVDERRRAGDPIDIVARDVVAHRNALKATFRAKDDPRLVALTEARNSAKYGNPLGAVGG